MLPPVLHHLGTFDVENYGDLLYPLLVRRLMTTHVQYYSLLAGDAPHEAGFQTRAIRSLFESEDPLRMLIGGGDILRTDADLIARHYGRNSRISDEGLRHSIGVSGLVGYRLREKLPRVDAGSFYANRFRARWMNYPAVGPFIIAPRDLPPGSTVSYLSCGVPHEFKPEERVIVKRAFEEATFVYLRDEESAEKLRRAGVRRDLCVAPDVTVILSDQFDRADLSNRRRKLLTRLEIDKNCPVVCFQSQPYPGFEEREILDQLQRYRERTGCAIVLTPLGYCHGDHEFLQSLAGESQGVVKYAGVTSIFDMMALIAGSDLFVGTSLHGNITAFSFGIPHVVGPLPVTKAAGFLKATDLPAELRLNSWREMDEAMESATMLGQDFFAAKAREAKAKVYKAVEELLDSLSK